MCSCPVMAAVHAEPSGDAGASLPRDPDSALPQPDSRVSPQPPDSERSASAQAHEPQAGGKPVDPLVLALAEASRQFDGTGNDPERNCWLAVHRHMHGVLPSEYDIREIDEDLYLAVLAYRRAQDSG